MKADWHGALVGHGPERLPFLFEDGMFTRQKVDDCAAVAKIADAPQFGCGSLRRVRWERSASTTSRFGSALLKSAAQSLYARKHAARMSRSGTGSESGGPYTTWQ